MFETLETLILSNVYMILMFVLFVLIFILGPLLYAITHTDK